MSTSRKRSLKVRENLEAEDLLLQELGASKARLLQTNELQAIKKRYFPTPSYRCALLSSCTRIPYTIPRRTSLPYDACSHKKFGSLTCERDFPTCVTLQNLTAFLDCWLQIPGDLRMHCRLRLDFLFEVSWIIGP